METRFEFELPGWVSELIAEGPTVFDTDEARMALAIRLARKNVERGTGGPFGAAVFDASGRLIAPGVNLVPASRCSILHAEMVAIALAQKTLGRLDLGDGGKAQTTLACSTEPCAMCMGAVPWSGVTRLICGSRDEDARAIGFDEGAKAERWQAALEQRGISVVRDLLRDDAIQVFIRYDESDGMIY